MQKTLLFYVLIFMLAVCTVSALLPYPIFSSYTNITEQNAYEINNFQETEHNNNFSITPKVLNLEFKDINSILPDKFEIIDIETEEILNATRIGGNSHADVVLDENSQALFHEICENWNWSRRPVLVKINETAYLPASIICYPHGYNNHFCLHFKNSKTHGTNRVDTESQKAIDKAFKIGKSLIGEQN